MAVRTSGVLRRLTPRPLRGRPGIALLNAGWLTGGKLLGDVLTFLLFLVISRRFGPPGVGQYAYGFAIANLVFVAVNFGLDEYGVRECARRPPDEARALLSSIVGTQTSLALISVLVLAPVLLVEVTAERRWIILSLSIYQILYAFSRTLFIPPLAREAMAGPAAVDFMCRGGIVALGLVLILGFGASLPAALVAFPLGGAALVLVGSRYFERQVSNLAFIFDWGSIRKVLAAAWPFAASYIVFQIYARADVIMLTWMRDETAAGIYASSLKFLEVAIMPLYFLGVAFYPVLSKAFVDSNSNLHTAGGRLLGASLSVGGFLVWFLVFPAAAILVPLLGTDFHEAVPLLRIMACVPLFLSFDVVAVRLLLAMNRQHERVKLQFYGVLVNVAANALLIPLWGPRGAVVALIFAVLLTDGLYYRTLRRHLRLSEIWKGGAASFQAVEVALVFGLTAWWLTSDALVAAIASLVGLLAVQIHHVAPRPWSLGP